MYLRERRQRLGFPATFPQIHPDQGRDVRGHVLAALVRLPLDDTRDTAAREQREPGHEDEGDDGPHEEEALPELLGAAGHVRSEEHTSELQSQSNLVCRLLL